MKWLKKHDTLTGVIIIAIGPSVISLVVGLFTNQEATITAFVGCYVAIGAYFIGRGRPR
jgi:hypothetical protein